MSTKKVILVVIAAIVGFVLIMGATIGGKYNQIIQMDENVSANWAQVENQLKRRADLIPNLIQTVKGYASHEEEIFNNVAEARSKLMQADNVKEYEEADSAVRGSLGRLIAIAENYPDLKADSSFLSLQDELAGTENRIAVERKRYNDSVRLYNMYIRTFPNSLLAGFFNFTLKPYFEVDEEDTELPEVSF
ncbi:MAG: LemA family protein [Candidatus Muiribacteriota bacterium]